jgi:ribosome-binding protein aMBF1 (putative translation factor)
MIENDRQYQLTRSQADKFERALAEIQEMPVDATEIDPLIQQAITQGMQSQLEELRAEIEAYEALSSGRPAIHEADDFADLPRALVQARLDSGLTQQQFAARLGLTEHQIQRFEATEYAGASLDRIRQVLRALGMRVRVEILEGTSARSKVTPSRKAKSRTSRD